MENAIKLKDFDFFGSKGIVLSERNSASFCSPKKSDRFVGYYIFSPRICFKRNLYGMFMHNNIYYFILNNKYYDVDRDEITFSTKRITSFLFEFNVFKEGSLIFSDKVFSITLPKDDSLNSHFLMDIVYFLSDRDGREHFKRLLQGSGGRTP